MPQGYSKELLEHYMKEEQDENKKKQEQEKKQKEKAAKKTASELEKTRRIAQLALEEVQKCRVENANLEKTVKKNRTIAIIAMVIAVICMAMVMGGEVAAMQSMLP